MIVSMLRFIIETARSPMRGRSSICLSGASYPIFNDIFAIPSA